MDQFKKYKLKQWIKKKKALLIGSGIFLVVGIIAWIIGSFMSGENPIKWLTSPFAITCYIIIGIGLCVLGFIFFLYFMNNKTGE